MEAIVADGCCYPSLHDGPVATTDSVKVIPVGQGVTCDAMEYGEVRGVDVDFDHLLTAYRHLLTVGLLDGLVVVVADTIKTTAPLEVEAVDVALTEEPPVTGETSALQLKVYEEAVQRLHLVFYRFALLSASKLELLTLGLQPPDRRRLASDLDNIVG